tara:strand:- start:3454 stop:3594 length:141 start_codon:yes stop_codon:yes gene_type:complete
MDNDKGMGEALGDRRVMPMDNPDKLNPVPPKAPDSPNPKSYPPVKR